jgi:hypothetical protein
VRNLSGTTAAAQKDLAHYRVVWLVEIDAKLLNGTPATLRYGSRKYVLSGAGTYAGGLNPGGLRLGWATLRDRGGLASVSDFQVELAAGGGLATTLAAYVLDNSVVRVYAIFVTGAEVSTDRVLLQTGALEGMSWSASAITLNCIDVSDRDWREVPTHKVNLGEHPYAPLGEWGQVVPVTFGTFSGDTDDPSPCLAATRCLDRFRAAYTSGQTSHPDEYTRPVEGVDDVKAVADVGAIQYLLQNFTDSPSPTPIIRAADLDRTLRLAPLLPLDSPFNTCDTWLWCLDNDTATKAVVADGKVLGLQWQGVSERGTITAVNLHVEADGGTTGPMAVSVYFGADLLVTYAGSTSINEDLQPLLGDAMVEAWHFEQLKISIAPTSAAAVELTRIYLVIAYAGQATTSASGGKTMFQADLDGLANIAGDQNYVIAGTANATATGPVAQLAAVLSGKDLFNLPSTAFHAASFEAAYAARDGAGYAFHFQLMQAVGWDFWDALCFEAGLDLFPDAAGKWHLVARDASASPVHAFTTADIALKDARRIDAEPDVQASLTATRDVINEVVLRYDYDPVTERCRRASTRTAQYRYTGTCTISGTTLTDASAHFSTGDYPAAVGHRIYVAGHFTLVVVSVDSDTALTVALWDRDPGPLADVGTAHTYYGGAGVSGTMVESWLKYQTVNPLGAVYAPVTDQGGYPSSFLYDDAGETAETVLDYLEAWFSRRRMTVEFSTFLRAVDVELGDTVTLDCPLIPAAYASANWLVTGVRPDPATGQIRLRVTEKPAA